MAYAENTSVAFEKSVVEIITMLKRAGATAFHQIEAESGFMIQFRLSYRVVRFAIEFPSIDQMPTRDGRNSLLSDKQRQAAREQRIRQKGRALMLVVKAKLESVESKVETFEQAFLANVVMSDNQTFYDRARENIALEYERGTPQPLMIGGPTNG